MEPISTAASVLTLLGATSGTIKVVYDAINTFVDAPREIKTQSKSMESFCLTIDTLIHVCEQIPSEFPLKLNLCGIEDLVEDARLLDTKLKAKSVRVTATKIGRVREGCEWMLFDKQTKKFFKSLGTWNIILSQALWAAQMLVICTMHISDLKHTLLIPD
jgi:hypothetical protein